MCRGARFEISLISIESVERYDLRKSRIWNRITFECDVSSCIRWFCGIVSTSLEKNCIDVSWLTFRAILPPLNSQLALLIGEVARSFPGSLLLYRSADSISCESLEAQSMAESRYTQKLTSTIEESVSLPNHEIKLRKGYIVMLLRKITACSRRVNGNWKLVERISTYLLFLASVSGSKKGVQISLLRTYCPIAAEDFPIPMFRRRQLPVRVLVCNENQRSSRTVHNWII